MKAVKYDAITDTYTAPFDVDVPNLLSEDWNRESECPSCHKKVAWGTMVNCGDYYTENGLWRIPVCEECARKIWKSQQREREMEEEDDENDEDD